MRCRRRREEGWKKGGLEGEKSVRRVDEKGMGVGKDGRIVDRLNHGLLGLRRFRGLKSLG